MRRRARYSLWIAAALLLALGVALVLRSQAPPEAARLLPESDAIVFVHLKPIRLATHFDRTPLLTSPDLQRFTDATGIVPERDIDSAAFALHRVPGTLPAGKQGRVPADLFVSEVFVGRFDGQRLQKYLQSIATARETYAGREVYSIPVQTGEPGGQVLRVAQLGYDTIGASDMPTSEQIHSMLDRSRASALGTPGSSLLAARYHDVPLLSEAWAIGHIGLPFAENGQISALGLQLPLAEDTDLVASLGYNAALHPLHGGGVHLRIVEFAPDATSAQRTVEGLTTLLSILRGITSVRPPRTDADTAMRAVIDSLTLVQHNDRAELDATASIEQVKALAAQNSSAETISPSDATRDATPGPVPASK